MFITNALSPLPPETPAAALATAWRLVLPGNVTLWDEAARCWKLAVYDLGQILALQHTNGLLDGHPERDLPVEAWGYLDFPPHEKYKADQALAAWDHGGYYLGVQPYAIQPNKKRTAYRIRRFRLRHLLQHGILTREQVAWLEMVCVSSEIALEKIKDER